MTRSQRKAQLVLWLVLGPLTLVLLWLAVSGRPPSVLADDGATSGATTGAPGASDAGGAHPGDANGDGGTAPDDDAGHAAGGNTEDGR